MNRICTTLILIFSLSYAIADAKYKKDLPPRRNGEPINVESSMYLLDISEVNEERNEFTVQMYFRQGWQDDRLKFDDGDVKFLSHDEIENIWKPDLFFVEEAGGQLHHLTVPNMFARVFSNGTVLYSIRMTLALRCRMDFKHYPHDAQICSFSVESYGFASKDIQLHWVTLPSNKAVTYDKDINLPEYRIADLEYGEKSLAFTFGNYSRLDVSITFERKIGFFLTKLIIPYILLIIAAYLGFWIHPKFVIQRMALVLIVLFIMIALSMDMNSHIPESAYTKGVDVWIYFCVAFAFVAFLEFVYVSTIQETTDEQQPDENAVILSGLSTEKSDEKTEQPFLLWRKKSTIYRSLTSSKLDVVLRIAYPILFGGFNLIYWSYYAS